MRRPPLCSSCKALRESASFSFGVGMVGHIKFFMTCCYKYIVLRYLKSIMLCHYTFFMSYHCTYLMLII